MSQDPAEAQAGNDGQILLERHGHIAVLTIARPEKLNSFTLPMIRDIDRCTAQVRDDDEIRCLVVTGAGSRAFSAGGDLETLLPATVGAGTDLVNPDPSRRFFSDLFKPIVAAVRGVCIGGGLELLLGTDLRIAGYDARFGLGEVRWGLIPGAGAHARLPRQICWSVAMQMLLTGEPISAARAYEVGLVNELVASEDVLSRAICLAERIAANGPVAVQTAKEIAVRGMGLTDAFIIEHALNTRVLRSKDAIEGPRAFAEKRDPQFTGR